MNSLSLPSLEPCPEPFTVWHGWHDVRPGSGRVWLAHSSQTPVTEYWLPAQAVQFEWSAVGSVPGRQLSHADCSSFAFWPGPLQSSHRPPVVASPGWQATQPERARLGAVPARQLSHADCSSFALSPSTIHGSQSPPVLTVPGEQPTQSSLVAHSWPIGHVWPLLHRLGPQAMPFASTTFGGKQGTHVPSLEY